MVECYSTFEIKELSEVKESLVIEGKKNFYVKTIFLKKNELTIRMRIIKLWPTLESSPMKDYVRCLTVAIFSLVKQEKDSWSCEDSKENILRSVMVCLLQGTVSIC